MDFKSNALTTRPQLLAVCKFVKNMWRCRGSNPGPFTCKANALPLSYIPNYEIPLKETPKLYWLTISIPYSESIEIAARSYLWRQGTADGVFSTCNLELDYTHFVYRVTVHLYLICTKISFITEIFTALCLRPYHVENTSSRPITEVKQH